MRAWGFAAVAAALLLAACGTVEVVDKTLWDPCQISPDAMAAVGVGPEIKTTDYLTGEVTDFALCSWTGPDFSVQLESTTHTIDEMKSNPLYIEQRPVVVGSRSATVYGNSQDSLGAGCSVMFDTSVGVLIVSAIRSPISRPVTSPCDFALSTARTLDPALPQ